LFDPLPTDVAHDLFEGSLRPVRLELASPAPSIVLEVSE